jgi:hypothetical protein
MAQFRKIKDSEEAKARARLIAHFEDNPESVFYSRQLEVLYEGEYFHWGKSGVWPESGFYGLLILKIMR